MKKIFVFGIVVLILWVFVFAQERDTGQLIMELDKYQNQIDSLKGEVDKVKRDAYEKAIEGANRSVNISILVVTFVSLFVAGLGLIGYFKIRDVRAEIKKQLEEAQKIKEEAERCLGEIRGKGIKVDKVLQGLKTKVASQKEVQPTDFTKEIAVLTTKDAKEAIKAYEDLSDRIFGGDVYGAMAYNYYKLGEFEKCINELRKYLKVNPTDAEAYYNWGTALSDLAGLKKDEALYGESIEKHDKAIEINPKDANAWYNRACAFSLWGKREEALENLRKAIELDVKGKEDAKKDEDFKNLWGDEDFKKLVE